MARLGWLMGVAAAVASVATAQPPASEMGETVTVTGERTTPRERRERAAAYVRRSGVAFGERAVARWEDALCVRVIGLRPADSAAVSARLRTIAQDAGVQLARPGCRPNAVVAFVSDAGTALRQIAARRPRSLEQVGPGDRRALVGGTAPIRWWYATQARGGDGDDAMGQPMPAMVGEGSGSGATLPGNMDTSFQTVRGSSLISSEAIRAIYAAHVVVDAPAVAGMGLAAVTDYAALVLLAEVRPTDTPPPGSILDLVTAPAPDRRLTGWDTTFLRELYRLPLAHSARRQRQLLTRAILAGSDQRRD